jgi:putative salt-induced outer membrane protein YdiY
MNIRAFLAIIAMLIVVSIAGADTIVFKNGDKLTGKIQTMDGGKITIATAVAGTVTVDIKDIVTFSTDGPVDIRTADGKKLNQAIAAGDDGRVKVGAEVVPLSGIGKINPPAEKWSGSVVVNGSIARGNTNTDDLGVAINAALRRNNDADNDRFTVGGGYNFGSQKDPDTGDKVTATDNWFALGKYDKYWSPKFYGYAMTRVEHDRIADLNYRLLPGVGVGYQFIEKPDMNLAGEAGVTYVYEDYTSGDSEDSVALRLAYHFDKKLSDTVTFFHNLAYLPAFEDPGDYNLLTDAGVRAKLTKDFFAEFRAEWKRDSTPAPDTLKNDLRYILGVGWQF